MFKPKAGSVFGNGDLDGDQRQASRKAVGNQNRTQHSYGIKNEAKEGTQRAFTKAKKAGAGRPATPVEINPVKVDAIGQTYN